ncbi:MAG TPA: hypothetical protein VF495_15180 [Phenylobacterium sp.]
MTPAEVWRALGIRSTRDPGAVRRAYATRLRETHPEDDPEGFVRLRQAYETALGWTRHSPPQQPPEPADTDDAPTPAEPARAEPEAGPAAPDPLAGHWDACRTWIGRVEAGETSEADLLAELHALLASPALTRLEVFEDTGRGLARALTSISPRGDAFVEPVIRHFGWRSQALTRLDPPEVSWLLELGEDLEHRAHVRTTGAYRQLLAAPPKRMTGDLRRFGPSIRELLPIATTEGSWLHAEARPDTVAWWAAQRLPAAKPPSSEGWSVDFRSIWLVLVVGFWILKGFAGCSSSTVDGASPPVAAQAQAPVVPSIEGEEAAAGVQQHPDDPAAWARLCAATARGWTRDRGVEDCDRAVELQPASIDVALDRGFLNLKFARTPVAEAQFSRVLDQNPDSPLALYGRALARDMQGRKREGQADWCRALRLQPGIRDQPRQIYDYQWQGEFSGCFD